MLYIHIYIYVTQSSQNDTLIQCVTRIFFDYLYIYIYIFYVLWCDASSTYYIYIYIYVRRVRSAGYK